MKTILSFFAFVLLASTAAQAMTCPKQVTIQATGFQSKWPTPPNFKATVTSGEGYSCAYASKTALLNLESSSYGYPATYTATLRMHLPNGASYVVVTPISEPTAKTLVATGPSQYGTEEISDIADGGTSYGMAEFRAQGTVNVKFSVLR